jgi:hypothetical protein
MIQWRVLPALAFACAASSSIARGQSFDDVFGAYFQRTEGVMVGAGDAKEANAAAQTVDPWPPQVRNRRIPANGPRMTGAIERYQDVKRLKESAPPIAPESISPSGIGGNGAGR